MNSIIEPVKLLEGSKRSRAINRESDPSEQTFCSPKRARSLYWNRFEFLKHRRDSRGYIRPRNDTQSIPAFRKAYPLDVIYDNETIYPPIAVVVIDVENTVDLGHGDAGIGSCEAHILRLAWQDRLAAL